MYNYETLPKGLQGGMQRYLEQGLAPGSFLTAVLENNLFDAVMRADSTNLSFLPDIVKWLHWEVPMECNGSRVLVDAWKAKVREER